MGLYDDKECDCGSGKSRFPEFDGYGIFLCFACEDCEEQKMSKYRPDIMRQYECDEQIYNEEGY